MSYDILCPETRVYKCYFFSLWFSLLQVVVKKTLNNIDILSLPVLKYTQIFLMDIVIKLWTLFYILVCFSMLILRFRLLLSTSFNPIGTILHKKDITKISFMYTHKYLIIYFQLFKFSIKICHLFIYHWKASYVFYWKQ